MVKEKTTNEFAESELEVIRLTEADIVTASGDNETPQEGEIIHFPAD